MHSTFYKSSYKRYRLATKHEMLQFSLLIEEIVQKQKITYLDAILEYCDKTGLEVEVAAGLVNRTLKSKLHKEAQDLNLLAKSSRLPL